MGEEAACTLNPGNSGGGLYDSDGRLIVFTNDEDNSIWWTIQNIAGTDSWSHWWCLLGSVNTAPQVIANQDGRLQVFGHQPDGSIWTSFQTAAGGYTCDDGSQPVCEDGSQPVLSDDDAALMCISYVITGPSPTPSSPSGEEESEGAYKGLDVSAS